MPDVSLVAGTIVAPIFVSRNETSQEHAVSTGVAISDDASRSVGTPDPRAFLEIPSVLDEQHTVNSPADAEAYLSRLEAYAGQLDGETERLKSAAAQKVIAPDFL